MMRGQRRALAKNARDFLRMLKAFQAGFRKRIDADDLTTAARGVLQCAQHARMIGAGILPDHNNAIGAVKIFQGHGALARANGAQHCLTT